MDGHSCSTPQKLKSSPDSDVLKEADHFQTPSSAHMFPGQPSNSKFMQHGRFKVSPFRNTTPRSAKIINPFEVGLAERLHLPTICSPSLFQMRSRQGSSSSKFEWTIDDISSLTPANVEANEAQYRTTIDPDFEERAQAAISSYFKDQIIVPSPAEGNQRVPRSLIDVLISSPIEKSEWNTRNSSTQTLLTLPPDLPPNIEEIFKPYMTFTQNQQEDHTTDTDNLRRKLFDIESNPSNIDINSPKTSDCLDPPDSIEFIGDDISFGQSSSLENASFGYISPISKTSSPENKTETDMIIADTSKIEDVRFNNSNEILKNFHRSTPNLFSQNNSISLDASLNFHTKNLNLNSFNEKSDISTSINSFYDNSEEEQDRDMQIDQILILNENNSQHSNTPVRKRKITGKNLLRSISFNSSNDCTDSGFNEITTIEKSDNLHKCKEITPKRKKENDENFDISEN